MGPRLPDAGRARMGLLLDCDPGVDDAIALAVALGSPEADLVAVTTVAGNVGLPATTANALRVCAFLGRDDVPVVAGADRPLVRDAVLARSVHGSDGLGGAPLPAAKRSADPGFGPDRIVEEIMRAPGEITLVAVGPLTNIALALRREPRIASAARRLVVMGGSYTGGNVTAASEFNIHADPHAAAEVLAAAWEPVLLGLDVTLRVRVDSTVMQRWRKFGGLSTELLEPALAGYFDSRTRADGAGPAVHDACALACALQPQLFTLTPATVQVETDDAATLGRTTMQLGPSAGAHALVATAVDVQPLWALMEAAFDRVRAGVRMG